jgi:hypothetical protein
MYVGCRLERAIEGSGIGTRFLSLYSFFLDSPFTRALLLRVSCGCSDAMMESPSGMLRYREVDWRRI